MNPRVVITGCEAWFPDEGKSLHGDLWETEDCWIFNGVINDQGRAAWSYKHNNEESGLKIIILTSTGTGSYFERRGVVVAQKGHLAYLNKNAQEYTEKWA